MEAIPTVAASSIPSPPATLLPALLRGLHGAAPAIFWQGQALGRGLIRDKSALLAQQFTAAGIRRGSVVAVLLPRGPEVLVVLLALWRCGAVYAPLDSSWPQARIEAAVELCRAQMLVISAELQGLCARCAGPQLLLPPLTQWQTGTTSGLPGGPAAPSGPQPDDAAYLLFTSGSSGSPKAVAVNHGAVQTLFAGVLPLLQLQPGWRLLGCSALCFDIVFFEWLSPLLTGGSLVLADAACRQDAGRLLQLAQSARVDVIQATPSLWRLLLQQEPSLWLQRAIATGEALDTGTARQLLPLASQLWNLYGPTECTLWCSAHQVRPGDLAAATGSVSIGQALPGYELALMPHPQTATLADSGELLIRGPGVASGYIGATTEQQQRFGVDANGRRSFRSGDLCQRDAAGKLHFLHRCDSQLKVNGYRIEAGEVEARLRSHSGIADAVCLARQVEGGAQLLAFVVCIPGSPNKDRARWNRHLAEWLPDWMLPQRYFVLDAFPLDHNGKLDRRALLQLAMAGSTDDAAAADPLQVVVADIFRSVLEIDSVGPCDSFFDLGGNSMLAATLLLAINQHFACQLRLRDLLQAPPTVLRVCALLRAAGVQAPP